VDDGRFGHNGDDPEAARLSDDRKDGRAKRLDPPSLSYCRSAPEKR